MLALTFQANLEQYNAGACLLQTDTTEKKCHQQHRVYYSQGCLNKYGFLAVVFLGLYIIKYSPGMGIVPWILNSEIYPLRYRGIFSGIGAVTLWTANLIVSETFLTLTDALGTAGTFLLYAGFSFIGLVLIYFLVPDTKGLPFEDIETMLKQGFSPFGCKFNINQRQGQGSPPA